MSSTVSLPAWVRREFPSIARHQDTVRALAAAVRGRR